MSKTRDLANLLSSGDLQFTGGLNVDSNTLFVDEDNNRVGIGTGSPSVPFEIRDGSNQDYLVLSGIDGRGLKVSTDSEFRNDQGVIFQAQYNNHPNSGYFEFFGGDRLRQKIAPNGDISFYEDTGTTPKFFWDASAERLRIGDYLNSNYRATIEDGLFIENVTSSPIDDPVTYASDPQPTLGIKVRSRPDYQSTPGYGGIQFLDAGWNSPVCSLLVGAWSGDGNEKGFANDMTIVMKQSNSNENYDRVFRLDKDGDISLYNNNTPVGSITTGSSSTSFNTSSDYRLKENVVDITDGIDRLKQLPVYRFNFIADPDTTVDGFLAHEVQPYVPEAISGEKDEVEAIGDITDAEGIVIQEGVTEPEELSEGQTWTQTGERPVYQGIDQSKLVPLLTAALQEALSKIETLEARIDALETK